MMNYIYGYPNIELHLHYCIPRVKSHMALLYEFLSVLLQSMY